MPWYSTGTIGVAANGITATGTGTAFLGNVRVGDGITIAGSTAIHEVTGVTSNTQLTFAPAYAGPAGSGKAYRVAPVQGYDKDLADAFNALRVQFGDQLAALQPWAYAATAGQAREALGVNDASNLTAGLLNAARVPATLTPDKAFRRGNILGAVSQSGGVPTGAIIERGSNANGEYVRFTDGTQWCWMNMRQTHAASVDLQTTWTFPATFAGSAPNALPTLRGASASNSFTVEKLQASPSSTAAMIRSRFSAAQDYFIDCTAIGRWY